MHVIAFDVIASDVLDVWNQVLVAIQTHPYRSSLTLVCVLVALLAGRALSGLASRINVSNVEAKSAPARFRRFVAGTHQTQMSRWIGRVSMVSIWLAAVAAITLIWLSDQDRASVFSAKNVGTTLGAVALRAGESLIVFACSLALARALRNAVVSHFDTPRISRNLGLLVGRGMYTVTLIVGVIIILAIWGTGIALPVALLGALTVALSLALQDVLKNLVAGIYLLLEHPFSIGDRIALTPYTGEVEDIKIRYTSLRTADGQQVLIPNSMLFSSPVVNLSTNDGRRAALLVTVAAGGAEGFDQAEAEILRALEDVPAILYKPEPPRVTLSKATTVAIELQAVFWLGTNNPIEQANALTEAIERVRAAVAGADVAVLSSATASPL